MADQFDAGYTEYELTWLRSPGQPELAGRGTSRLGAPLVLAQGPSYVVGAANPLAANEVWNFGVRIPAMGDVAWVMVGVDVSLMARATADLPDQVYVAPIASIGTSGGVYAPVYGPGTSLTTHVIAAATYPILFAPTDPRPQSIFHPIDPQLTTRVPWDTGVMMQAPAAGLGANDWWVRLRGLRAIGFPIQAWYTGALWDVTTQRGS